MRVFQVRQNATGAILWTGAAADELRALDAMAHDAGYYDHSDLPDSIRAGGVTVEALTFQQDAATDGAARSQGRRTGLLAGRGGPFSGLGGASKARNV